MLRASSEPSVHPLSIPTDCCQLTADEAMSQPSGAIGSAHRLGAIAGIDADILRGEVAGPVAGARIARVQVHHDGHLVRQEAAAGSPFVEIERLAPAAGGNSPHPDVPPRRTAKGPRPAGT